MRLPIAWLWLFWIVLSVPLHVWAQAPPCGGSAGENIFIAGDFGSGAANVFPSNPGLAPGYAYTFAVPPDDGEYTITNDMNRWNFVFPAWLRVGDNSPDPNGYFMVVNASFSPGIFYERQINGLCENTQYTFSADVINLIRMGTTGHILPNVSFQLDDVTAFSTGPVPQNNRWNTYGFTFSTGPGQTSVKLTLRNNAPGGTGNDLGLDNINFSACGPQASVASDIAGAICDNEAHLVLTAIIAADSGFVQWQQRVPPAWDWQSIPGATDRTYASGSLGPGLHVFRYLYASTAASLANPRCRIASDSIVIEVIPVTFTVRDTLCEGLSYTLGDTVITTSGTYTHTFTGSKGCDSIVTLEMLFVPDPGIMADFDTRPPSCFGADDGLVSVISVSGTRPPYAFIVNDSIIPPPGMAASFPAGTYTVRIEDPNGCYDEDVVTIPDGQPFDITLAGETLIPLGHSTILVATGTPVPDSIAWKPEGAVSCGFCTEVIVTPLDDQWFTVIGTTEAGCIDSARLEVRVDRTPIIYVPNVFTPDGNGINDTWRVTLDPLNIPVIRTVYIFDRWGDMFLAMSDLPTMAQMDLWNGETPWGRAGPGTYVYMLVAELADGEAVRLSGDVTVIR